MVLAPRKLLMPESSVDGAGDLSLILKLRGVVDVDLHSQNVADLMCALVLEERARAIAP